MMLLLNIEFGKLSKESLKILKRWDGDEMKKVIYEVYIKGEKVKEYPHRIQTVIY